MSGDSKTCAKIYLFYTHGQFTPLNTSNRDLIWSFGFWLPRFDGVSQGYLKNRPQFQIILDLYYSEPCNYRPQRSWGKVMFLQASVILLTGGVCSWGGGDLLWGGAWSWGGLLPGGSAPGGCLVETPPRDGHCCGRYASYWNAFLFKS